MATGASMISVVKHLANGTLNESLCRVCLQAVDVSAENYVNTSMRVYTERKEYCTADVLERVCNIQIDTLQDSIVCSTCFHDAKIAYNFYLKCLESTSTLNFYTDEMLNQCSQIERADEPVCMTLPLLIFEGKDDFDVQPTLSSSYVDDDDDEIQYLEDDETEYLEDDDSTYYIKQETVNKENNSEQDDEVPIKKKRYYPSNIRRNRPTMSYRECLKCPVKYKFMSKLIAHMRDVHDICTFLCKICDTLVKSDDWETHFKMHTDVYQCSLCSFTFKKRQTLIQHLSKHKELNMKGYPMKKVEDDVKRYTCFYCGRRYKSEISFEAHVKKHEMQDEAQDEEYKCDSCPSVFHNAHALTRHVEVSHSNARPFACSHCDMRFKSEGILKSHVKTHLKNHVCDVCNGRFADARNLLWHKRLHTDERPFKCKKCDRAFVSLNRRNQHQLCAHTAPTKRCPICPALFHLTSMVNTHIKKVHLRANKRNYRTSKFKGATWKAETVAIQDLSVSIQNDLLEIQPGLAEA